MAQVAKMRPPITARPSGLFWPGSMAIGSMPRTMARAVIITGLSRVEPASMAAAMASTPSASRSRAKEIIRTLLAVATPMHMIAPVRAGTDTVVPVANSIQTMPASAVGKAATIMSGSSQDWKLTTISRKMKNDGDGEPDEQLVIATGHRRHLASQRHGRADRNIVRRVLDDLLDVRRHATEIAPLRRGVDVDDRSNVIVRDDGVTRRTLDVRDAAEQLLRNDATDARMCSRCPSSQARS